GAGGQRGVQGDEFVVPQEQLMRVMILGAGGMLGQDLVATAPADVEGHPFSRAALDITEPAAVEVSVRDVRPHVIINAAAYTKVDQAESEPAVAFRVNAE